LTTEPFGDRCREAGDLVRRLGTEALVAGDPATVRWLTGRSAEIEFGPPYPIGAGTCVVLDRSGRGTIICAEDDATAGPEVPGLEVAAYQAYSLTPLRAYASAARLLADALGDAGLLAVEPDATALSLVGGRPWVDAGYDLRALRMVKDEAEIAAIARACAVVSVGQRTFRAATRPGIREIEVFSAVHAAMEADAGTRVPVLPDLLSGERLLEVGRPPTERVIRADELALCDLAARGPLGLWADSCTTICVGRPTPAMRRLHDTCRRALDRGIALARPGIVAGELDAALRSIMADAGYAYPHHTGHGVGAGYHEEPRIVPGSAVRLESGMVIALEPAGFGDGIGARVEHVLVVTSDGGRVLTQYETRLEQ
jgi:Xaa-Pro dipeptidase